MNARWMALFLALALLGCDSRPAGQAPAVNSAAAPSEAVAAEVVGALPGDPVETSGSVDALGVALPLPVGWTSVPPSNSMRLAEIRVPAGDGASGECVVAISSAGGSVDGNITRWAGQVRLEDGSSPIARPVAVEVDGLRATVVELEGAYTGMGTSAPESDSMLRGAIIETPNGLLFVKMTGPLEPMRAAGPAFNHMIMNMRRR